MLLTERLRRVHDDHLSGVQPLHPATEPVDNCRDGVQRVHPPSGTGCNQDTYGMQSAQPRGAAAAPEPYEEPSAEPSAAAARAAGVLSGGHDPRGGGLVGEFFGALGSAWRLTAAQRGRLAPAVDAALRAGWTPAELAAFTGANTGGVRNPYAVLAARLSPDELPGPTGREGWWRQPPWCGECNRRTRRREDADGADAGRCPLCHPLGSTARRAGGDDSDTGRRAAAGRGWQADETGPLPGSRAASPQRQHAARNLNYRFAG